ncbi:hypothetical protein [Nocardia sp. NBC_01327]|uniref:hypothetical protein n=1 Tax=Nocardia sp. NBC_01327 TaxID=2903593 RepID=UPI002E1604B2|nr:hypothetical protein OG326_33015 [Nocardia sp. NBC_01327]
MSDHEDDLKHALIEEQNKNRELDVKVAGLERQVGELQADLEAATTRYEELDGLYKKVLTEAADLIVES